MSRRDTRKSIINFDPATNPDTPLYRLHAERPATPSRDADLGAGFFSPLGGDRRAIRLDLPRVEGRPDAPPIFSVARHLMSVADARKLAAEIIQLADWTEEPYDETGEENGA